MLENLIDAIMVEQHNLLTSCQATDAEKRYVCKNILHVYMRKRKT